MTDGELVRQARAGRTRAEPAWAYEQLVGRWAARVTALCHGRLGHAADAEDAAQESLVRAYFALDSLHDPDRFGPWLCGIARLVCLDAQKRRRRGERSLDSLHAAGNGKVDVGIDGGVDANEDGRNFAASADAGTKAGAAEESAQVMGAVERLSPELREAVMLYYYQDWRDPDGQPRRCTYQDIAALLGVSAATVNARLTQARATLRRELADFKP